MNRIGLIGGQSIGSERSIEPADLRIGMNWLNEIFFFICNNLFN